MKRYASLVILFVGCATAARAQQAPVLLPVDPPRWDVSAEAGWLGSNKSDIAPAWDDWFDVAAGGGAVGHYWTPHLRSELRVAFAGEGRVYEEQRTTVPGHPFPVFVLDEHRYRTTTVGAGLSYQFFENQWFHPSVGAGLEIAREREAGVGTSTIARPFASTGFKWYVNERAFARTDLRVSFSDGAAAHVTWTAGIGVDL